MYRTVHYRGTAHYSSKHKGMVLARDFKCMADFRDCLKILGWTPQKCHFSPKHGEKSNFDIINAYYAGTLKE